MINEVWAVYDAGDLYRLYASEDAANEARTRLAKSVGREFPGENFESMIEVFRIKVYDN